MGSFGEVSPSLSSSSEAKDFEGDTFAQHGTKGGRYCMPIEVVRRMRSCAKESNILFVFFHTFLLAQESIAKKGL